MLFNAYVYAVVVKSICGMRCGFVTVDPRIDGVVTFQVMKRFTFLKIMWNDWGPDVLVILYIVCASHELYFTLDLLFILFGSIVLIFE